MYDADIELLACPKTGRKLVLSEVASRELDGEIVKGQLKEPTEGRLYEIRNGIPRFIDDLEYNKTWDFKWRVLDAGRGLNYRIIDKADPAYQVHDLFDRNGYDGAVYEHARNGIALDVGCGVGQYSVRLLQEYGPSKLISLDLTFRRRHIQKYCPRKISTTRQSRSDCSGEYLRDAVRKGDFRFHYVTWGIDAHR